jgi:hypothetical protein
VRYDEADRQTAQHSTAQHTPCWCDAPCPNRQTSGSCCVWAVWRQQRIRACARAPAPPVHGRRHRPVHACMGRGRTGGARIASHLQLLQAGFVLGLGQLQQSPGQHVGGGLVPGSQEGQHLRSSRGEEVLDGVSERRRSPPTTPHPPQPASQLDAPGRWREAGPRHPWNGCGVDIIPRG